MRCRRYKKILDSRLQMSGMTEGRKQIPSFDRLRTDASLGMTMMVWSVPSFCQRISEHIRE